MRHEIQAIIARLDLLIVKVQGYADSCQNEERQESLENEVDLLEQARDSLQEIE